MTQSSNVFRRSSVGVCAFSRRVWNVAVVMACLLCLFSGRVPDVMAVDDAYIAGYAAAVLHNEFKAPKASVLVQNGVVHSRG